MKPGEMTRPVQSSTLGAPLVWNLPTATMRSFLMARSPTVPGAAPPSYRVAPRRTTSASTAGSSTAAGTNDRAASVRASMAEPQGGDDSRRGDSQGQQPAQVGGSGHAISP